MSFPRASLPAPGPRRPPLPPPSPPLAGPPWLSERLQRGSVLARLQEEAHLPGMVLVPARAFIGLGWLRACAEKLADPGWRDGASLTAFLERQVTEGAVAIPLYEQTIESLFIPGAAALGIVVIVGQFLAGAAILAGGFTNAALLGALFMNANFLLAGEPNPSAFYVVVQAILLVSQAGGVLGVDAELSATIRNPYLVAQPPGRGTVGGAGRGLLAATALACLFVAVVALSHVADWSAAGSVHDPAMVVSILAGLGAAWAAIGWLRVDPPIPSAPLRRHRRLFDLDAGLAGAPLGDPWPSRAEGSWRLRRKVAAGPARGTLGGAAIRDADADALRWEVRERVLVGEPGPMSGPSPRDAAMPSASPEIDRVQGEHRR